MSWSSGTYTKGNSATGGWTGDASSGIGIEAGRHDTQDNDFQDGINNCLTKDGQNTPTANLPMGGFKHTGVANATANDQYTAWAQLRNATPLFLDTANSRVGIGTSSPSVALDVQGTSTAASTISATRFAADATATQAVIRKSRGATVGTNATVTTSDSVGAVSFEGADGTGYDVVGRIRVLAGTVAAGNIPGVMLLETADSTGAITERVRIDSTGKVGIGVASPVYVLDVAGGNGNGIRYTSTGGVTTIVADSGGTIGQVGTITNHPLRLITNSSEKALITTGGQIQVGDGSAAAPVLSFGSDPDTGIFRPSADQIGISLGGTTRLYMTGQSAYFGNGVSSAAPSVPTIRATAGSGTNIAGADLQLAGGEGTGSGAGGAIRLFTAAAGTSGTTLNALTERMRIDSAGNVGIGTTAPGAKLDVNAASSSEEVRLRVGSTNKVVLGSDGTLKWGSAANAGTLTWDTGRAIIHSQTGQDLTFGSGSTADRMRIDSAGNVGIGGTPTLSSKLSVLGGPINSDDSIFIFDAARQVARMRMSSGIAMIESTFFSGAGGAYQPLVFRTSDTERMRITSAGNVGIGTSAPSAALDVVGGIRGSANLILTSASGSEFISARTGGATLQMEGGASTGAVRTTTSHPITFSPNSVEALRVKTTGATRFVPLTADPGTAEDGDVYYNSTTNKLRVRAAGAWVDLH
jgi:hypothetical protein